MGKHAGIISRCNLWGVDLLIFVTLGTQDKPFTRLLDALEALIQKGIIQDEVIVQAGSTRYKSNHMKILDYIEMTKFNQYVEQCDILICHAGVGTIINGINHDKSIMAVARRAQFGEHENDHQVEITTKFSKLGYIVGCLSVEEVEEKFPLLKGFKTHQYESNCLAFCALVKKLIDQEN